jgi:hypothetical protein
MPAANRRSLGRFSLTGIVPSHVPGHAQTAAKVRHCSILPTARLKRCSAHDRLGLNLPALSSATPQTKPPYFRANSLSG